jgi:hypothetical protein
MRKSRFTDEQIACVTFCHGRVGSGRDWAGTANSRSGRNPLFHGVFGSGRDWPGPPIAGSNPVGAMQTSTYGQSLLYVKGRFDQRARFLVG